MRKQTPRERALHRKYKRSRYGHPTGPTEEGSIEAVLILNEDEFEMQMNDAIQSAERFDDGFGDEIRAIIGRMREAVPTVCDDAMSYLHEVALEQTPIETGNLKEMSYHEPTADGARVVFPGPYAKYQHYNLQFRHPRGGNALFLELPMATEKEMILEIVAEDLRPYLEE